MYWQSSRKCTTNCFVHFELELETHKHNMKATCLQKVD